MGTGTELWDRFNEKHGVIYLVKYGTCNSEYVQETVKPLENQRHQMDFDEVKVIDSEIKNKLRKVVEAFQMRKKKRMLNRQGGFDLLWIYMQLRGGDGRGTTYPALPA